VVDELSGANQVVITTHNPLFVNRVTASNNVIVSENKAFPAKSIVEIRDVLGVHVSDNLQGAELVVVVEGVRDREFFLALAEAAYPKIWRAITDNRLAIDPLHSASKLSNKVSFHRAHMCAVVAFLDNDQSSLAAVEACLQEAHLERRDVTLAICPGKRESELEDCFVDSLTIDVLRADAVDYSKAKNKKQKWSDRVRDAYAKVGRPLDDKSLNAIKLEVGKAACKLGSSALQKERSGSLLEFLRRLQTLLEE
jgi:hypothetical protein